MQALIIIFVSFASGTVLFFILSVILSLLPIFGDLSGLLLTIAAYFVGIIAGYFVSLKWLVWIDMRKIADWSKLNPHPERPEGWILGMIKSRSLFIAKLCVVGVILAYPSQFYASYQVFLWRIIPRVIKTEAVQTRAEAYLYVENILRKETGYSGIVGFVLFSAEQPFDLSAFCGSILNTQLSEPMYLPKGTVSAIAHWIVLIVNLVLCGIAASTGIQNAIWSKVKHGRIASEVFEPVYKALDDRAP